MLLKAMLSEWIMGVEEKEEKELGQTQIYMGVGHQPLRPSDLEKTIQQWNLALHKIYLGLNVITVANLDMFLCLAPNHQKNQGCHYREKLSSVRCSLRLSEQGGKKRGTKPFCNFRGHSKFRYI